MIQCFLYKLSDVDIFLQSFLARGIQNRDTVFKKEIQTAGHMLSHQG